MGRRINRDPKSQTLPPSPSHSFSSSSSSDFEFIISSFSPRKSSSNLSAADDLFYKGQLLPLHLSPRLSMVRTLFLASSSTSSSSDTNTTASRDSTESSNSTDSNTSFTSDIVLFNECDSSRPSSVTEEDEFRRLKDQNSCLLPQHIKKTSKYFSLARFSSVFKKENKNRDQENGVSGSSVKRAKEVIRKYVKKVKPLYEKLSQKQQQQQNSMSDLLSIKPEKSVKVKRDLPSTSTSKKDNNNGIFSNSFSGNLRYPRRKSSVLSCPSSMRSSPNHSGVLCRTTVIAGGNGVTNVPRSVSSSGTSSMEELQNAIQGAIAHCKNSQNKNLMDG
ncbi:hypothetical protein AQUCO_01700435v1 [Aquilegia coerulea]|uniref:Membrane-associated kinase regulator 1 n=1 Tax=Aquilegia coerulea TaxID=218851 RepID=A0A2G5DNL8_AQUCA|nr:hypothetical protein AQUCO_01700435v1 [Aquilegia coerulea]